MRKLPLPAAAVACCCAVAPLLPHSARVGATPDGWSRAPAVYHVDDGGDVWQQQQHQLQQQHYQQQGVGQSFPMFDAAGPDELRALQHALDRRQRSEIAGYIGDVLSRLCGANDQLAKLAPRLHRRATTFHTVAPPPLDIRDYVSRVAAHVAYPNICFILSLAYIDRLAEESCDAHVYVTSLTAHRLFASALLVAAKFVAEDDDNGNSAAAAGAAADGKLSRDSSSSSSSAQGSSGLTRQFDAAHYQRLSRVTGLEPHELLRLEHDLLGALDQNAFVSAEELVRYAGGLLGDAYPASELNVVSYEAQPPQPQARYAPGLLPPEY